MRKLRGFLAVSLLFLTALVAWAAEEKKIRGRSAVNWRKPSRATPAFRNLIYFHEADKGGHFAAWEYPERAAELRAAFKSLR